MIEVSPRVVAGSEVRFHSRGERGSVLTNTSSGALHLRPSNRAYQRESGLAPPARAALSPAVPHNT